MEQEINIVAQFDDLIRCYTSLLSDHCEKSFLIYVQNEELNREKWREAVNEAKRLKVMLDSANKDISTIDSKLACARRMLDDERQQRKKVEAERDSLIEQLESVRKILFTDSKNTLADETREKLSFLNGMGGFCDYTKLDTITEYDYTSASNLSDISYSRSEDDLDEYSRCKPMKKHRPSYPDEVINIKRRRSSRHEICVEGQQTDHLVATTTVTVKQSGPITAKSVIEKFPQVKPTTNISTPVKDIKSGFSTPVKECGLSTPDEDDQKYPPTAPSLEPTPQRLKTPCTYESALDKINARAHTFVPKKVYMPEMCVCGSKINFGGRGVKCTTCHGVAHFECRDKIPLPCIAMGTPSRPGVVGFIEEYTPLVPPMIPAIVIHCINEVEQRGLTELGLYRVPGSEREVHALKQKFLKGKGAPALSSYDIHTICSCLKDFFKSLQDSLIPSAAWSGFAEAVEKKDDRHLYQIISDLPQPNRDTLAFLMLHLQRVAQSPQCKMPITNLAKVFGLTLTRCPSTNDQDLYTETHIALAIVEALLSLSADYWSSFIVEPPDQPNTPATIRHTPSTESLMRKTSKFLKTPKTPGSTKKRYFEPYVTDSVKK